MCFVVHVQVIAKTLEIPVLPIENIVEIFEIQVVQGTPRSEALATTLWLARRLDRLSLAVCALPCSSRLACSCRERCSSVKREEGLVVVVLMIESARECLCRRASCSYFKR